MSARRSVRACCLLMIIMLALTATALAEEYLVVGGDGHELLADAERLHPDVIVLDISMPGLNGIEGSDS